MKTSLMLVFGGVSSEHEVSKMSARNVFAALDNSKYDVHLVYIDKSGKWWLVKDIDGHHHDQPQLIPALGQKQFLIFPGGRSIKPDIILPVVHGGDGEDGKIASLGDMLNVPVVGCDAIASAVCWDKFITKSVLEHNGIKTAPYLLVRKENKVPEFDEVISKLGCPFFVKPTRCGSSVGVSRVEDKASFRRALDEAFKNSNAVLIEKNLPGKELEVAVLGNTPSHKVSGIGEIKAGQLFYSYSDKYDPTSEAEVISRADLPEVLSTRIREIAGQAYEITGCTGLARVDFILDENDEIFVSEINTFPGFTSISLYPRLWHEQGIRYAELIDTIINLARKNSV